MYVFVDVKLKVSKNKENAIHLEHNMLSDFKFINVDFFNVVNCGFC
jgi:hypothetical protein